MITIKELLNKIYWDKNLNKEDYEIYYLDRLKKKLIEIKIKDIVKVEDNTLVLENKTIPLHRIKKVTEKGKIIWQRN